MIAEATTKAEHRPMTNEAYHATAAIGTLLVLLCLGALAVVQAIVGMLL